MTNLAPNSSLNLDDRIQHRLALEKALELRKGLCNSRWRWKSIAELNGMHPEVRSTYNLIVLEYRSDVMTTCTAASDLTRK